MKLLGKSKVMKHRVKPEITYPIIRFPQSEIDLSGEVTYIFKTEYKGKPIYILSLDEEFDGEIKVAQPDVKSDLESRVERLEKKLYEHLELENKNEKRNGPAEIRTQDPRRVKAMS